MWRNKKKMGYVLLKVTQRLLCVLYVRTRVMHVRTIPYNDCHSITYKMYVREYHYTVQLVTHKRQTLIESADKSKFASNEVKNKKTKKMKKKNE